MSKFEMNNGHFIQEIDFKTNVWTEIRIDPLERYVHAVVEYHPDHIIAWLSNASSNPYRLRIPPEYQAKWKRYLRNKGEDCSHENVRSRIAMYSTVKYCEKCGEIIK
jgi:hypothetical protein